MSAVFDFSTFPILTTERLRLREITNDDTEGLIELFSSEESMRFLNFPPVTNQEEARATVERFAGEYERQEAINWGITLQGDDRLIGNVGTDKWEKSDRRIDVGWTIVPALWGLGYATEAARAMIGWLFVNLDLHRISADCTDGNIASERVMLKCGFTYEGTWREACWEHGRFVDIKQFGLLRREFKVASQDAFQS